MQSSILNPSNSMPTLQNMNKVLMENIGVSPEELAVMTLQDIEDIYQQYMDALGEQNQQNSAHLQQKSLQMNESEKNQKVEAFVEERNPVGLGDNTSQLVETQKQGGTSKMEEEIWINGEKYHKAKCLKNQTFIRSSNRLNMICQPHPLTLQEKRQTVLKIFTPDMAQTIKHMTEFELSEIMLSIKQLHTKQNLLVDWVPCKQQKGKKFFVYFATKEEHDVHKSQQNISKTKKKPIEKKVFYDDADFFNERQAQPIQKAPSEEHKTQSPKKGLFSAKFKKSIETQTDQEQLTKPKQSQKCVQQSRKSTKLNYYKKTYIIDSQQQQNPFSTNKRSRPADSFIDQLSNECYKIDINALVKSIVTARDKPNPKVISWIAKLKCFCDKLLNLYMNNFQEQEKC